MPLITLRLRSWIVGGIAAAFMVLPALLFTAPVWADTTATDTSTVSPTTTINQVATTGAADITAVPPVVDPTTTTDPTTPVDNTSQTPATPAPQTTTGSDPTAGQTATDPAQSCVQPNTNSVQPTSDTAAPATTQTPADGSSLNANQTVTVNNNLCATAQSGDAAVTNNNSAGNASSGNAQSVATILNLLQSATGLGGGNLATFTQDVYGNVNGNIYIDPGALATNVTSGCPSACSNGLSVNTDTNSQINNNIVLGATSGNATVADNGKAGNATSGNATTLLNLINIINSLISSGKSFVGTVNIYGNLNGDILLPSNFFDSLLASNSAAGPTTGGGQLNLNNSASINNNLSLNATSGNATVADNGKAGNATSGNASTNLTLLNLTNQQIVGSNDLLVFVNVLGQWYGLIFNAPAGTTAADLGGGVDPASGLCTCNSLSLAANNTSSINNNIYLSSTSGDASVTGNHRAGNATSGSATASANVVNLINSSLALTNWFGILFINVFGSWFGSLETAPVVVSDTTTPPAGNNTPQQTFSFVSTAGPGGSGTADTQPPSTVGQQHVLGASTGSMPAISNGSGGNGILRLGLLGGLAACCGLLAGLKRRKQHQPA